MFYSINKTHRPQLQMTKGLHLIPPPTISPVSHLKARLLVQVWRDGRGYKIKPGSRYGTEKSEHFCLPLATNLPCPGKKQTQNAYVKSVLYYYNEICEGM